MKRDLSAITPYCGFDVPTWLDHLRAIDENVFTEIKKRHENTEAWDRDLLETWLKQCHPDVHVVLRGAELAWKNCATTAFHQVVFLLEVFDQGRAQNTDQVVDENEGVEDTPLLNHLTQTPEREREEEEKKPSYREKGMWDRSLVGPNLTLYRDASDAKRVLRSDLYRTYYAVNGLWEMENLLSYFERQDIQAVGVKDKGIPAEMEMLRYKVVTQEVYTPDHTKKKRQIKKKKL